MGYGSLLTSWLLRAGGEVVGLAARESAWPVDGEGGSFARSRLQVDCCVMAVEYVLDSPKAHSVTTHSLGGASELE